MVLLVETFWFTCGNNLVLLLETVWSYIWKQFGLRCGNSLVLLVLTVWSYLWKQFGLTFGNSFVLHLETISIAATKPIVCFSLLALGFVTLARLPSEDGQKYMLTFQKIRFGKGAHPK